MQTTTLLVLGLGLLLSIMLTVGLMFIYGRVRDLAHDLDSIKQRQAKFVKEIQHLRKIAGKVDERFSQTAQEISQVRDQADRVQLPMQNQASYTQAVRMIERGENPREIASVCGLSRAETDLLFKLHQKSTERGIAETPLPRQRNAEPNFEPPPIPVRPSSSRAAMRSQALQRRQFDDPYDDDDEYSDTVF